MQRCLIGAAVALVAVVPLTAAEITGKYVEVRTCAVWAAPCFANADGFVAGKHGMMAWKVDKGSIGNVTLDGLGVVAVIKASDTLGLKQTGEGKAVLIVDARANQAQKDALIKMAKGQAGDLLKNVVAVETAPIELATGDCEGGGCATFKAGSLTYMETRCVDQKHDKACGNESACYPPLSKGVTARVAVAVEHGYKGPGFNETWQERDRRGAYVGSFAIR